MSAPTSLICHSNGRSSQGNMAGERKKRHTDQKGGNKTDPSYVEDITVYAERLKISTDTPLKNS